MSLHSGSILTQENVQYDQQRIASIGLFNRVRLDVIPTGPAKANLLVQVVERWYLIPYPIFGIKEGKWRKAFFGAGLVHTNFLGRNEKLYFAGALGYDPFGSLAFRNPFVDDAGTIFLEFRLSYGKVRNRSNRILLNPADVFDEKHFSISTTIGKRFDNYFTAWVGAEYRMITIDDYIPTPTISPSGTDRYPVLTTGLAYDTRDLFEYPSAGTLVRLTASKYGIPGNDLDYERYSIDLRRFIPIVERWTLAGRFFTSLLSGGISPSYDHSYLGYDYHIRGHYTEVIEGENVFGATAELHYTLLPPVYFRSSFLPSQFGVMKFGMTLALFADMGSAWFRGDTFNSLYIPKGYGVGIHFQLPYSAILRTEYAWDENGRGQFIVDVGSAL